MNSKQKYLVSLCMVLFFVGTWMTFILPGQIAKNAFEFAQKSFSEAQQELSEIEQKMAGMVWYKPGYLESVEPVVQQIQKELLLIDTELKQAESGNATEKRKHSGIASHKLLGENSVLSSIKLVKKTLSNYEGWKVKAKTTFSNLQKQITEQNESIGNTAASVEKGGVRYLLRYINAMKASLTEAEKENTSAYQTAQEVEKLLPSDETKSSGDPIKALELIAQGHEKITSAEEKIISVQNEIAFQNEAIEKAELTFFIFKQSLENTNEHLNAILNTTPLLADKALHDVFLQKALAETILNDSENALKTEVENGKKDLATAYRCALNGVLLADQVVKEADHQVSMYNDSLVKVENLREKILGVKTNLTVSTKNQNILASYHAHSVWNGLGGNLENAGQIVAVATEVLKSTTELLRDQKYSIVLSEVKKANANLDHASQLLSALNSVTQKLEGYRSEWPRAERQTQSTIDDEEGNIRSYGSHSYSAKSDFDEAEELLKEARKAASQKDYETAVSKAKRADDLADGTGRRAYAAYEDSQDDSSISFGSDSGSWGGGSSGGDGGGWSGGSSGSDGGGWE